MRKGRAMAEIYACLGIAQTKKLLSIGPPDSNFMVGGNDKAPVPVLHFFNLEDITNPIHKSNPARLAQSNKQDSLVSPWGEAADVREIQILCDEKAPGSLCRVPDARVVLSSQPFLGNRIRCMTELSRMRTSRNGRFSSSLIFTECLECWEPADPLRPMRPRRRSRRGYPLPSEWGNPR